MEEGVERSPGREVGSCRSEPAPLEEAGGLGGPWRVWKWQGVQGVGIAVAVERWGSSGSHSLAGEAQQEAGTNQGPGAIAQRRCEAASISRHWPPGSSLFFPWSDHMATGALHGLCEPCPRSAYIAPTDFPESLRQLGEN